MALAWLQNYIEATFPSACVPVDLLKIARTVAFPNHGPRPGAEFGYPFEYSEFFFPTPFCLVIDGECCLHRLYGGFFGDWVCGGQWNRMVDFLTTFVHVLVSNNIEVTVFLNGASEPHRLDKWIEKQRSDKEKITQVLRHVAVKGTPPPKVWWVPPNCLRSCLRMVFRHLNVNVVISTLDHRQEVMNFVRKHHYHGLIAEDSEYMVFDPPKYFSAENLKLTFKGCLETKEYVMNEVTRCLNLHPSRICIVAALLGNHIVTESDLAIFHHGLCPEEKGKIPPNKLIKAVVDFVRNIPSVDDLDVVAKLVFGISSLEKMERFKRCVFYYARGNKNATRFHSSVPGQQNSGASFPAQEQPVQDNEMLLIQNKPQRTPLLPTPGPSVEANAVSQNQNIADLMSSKGSSSNAASVTAPVTTANAATTGGQARERDDMHGASDISKFASETVETERSSLQAYRQLLNKKHNTAALYQILTHQNERNCDGIVCAFGNERGGVESSSNLANHREFPVDSLAGNCAEGTTLEASVTAMSLNSKNSKKNSKLSSGLKPHVEVPLLPKVSAEVMRVARERHQIGLMNPAIFQVLSQGELKIPTTFEDDIARELPSPSLLFRPLRQMVYALLFNHHHLQYLAEQKKEKDGVEEKSPDIFIKEWLWTKGNKYNRPDLVPSMPLGWAVPTITRLWFGSGPDDNKRRLQAFLSCMRSNNPLMRNTNYVPQHCVILCCVLRYVMTHPEMPVLRKQELDAFLVQAVDPHLTDVTETQKLELPLVATRGVQLAAMFMQGVENALFANDACGAPVPWLMCCPWLFFDGKIFHRTLLKANGAKNLIDLCDNRIDEVAKVERMRTAVLEGIQVQFAHSSVTPVGQRPPPFPNFPVPVPGIASRGRGHQRVVPRGGQLEVAGVVVGSWGPNYGQGPRSPSRSIPPQIVSVGGAAARGRGGSSNLTNITRGQPIRPQQVLHANKPANSAGGKTNKPRPDSVKTGNGMTENMSVFRNVSHGCSLEMNSQNLDFGNMNQHIPSVENETTSRWEGSFASSEKL